MIVSVLKKISEIFHNFFLNLSKRERIIFCVTISFVSLLFLDRLVISPVFFKMQSLDKKIREKKASIKKTLRILAEKDRIEHEKNKFSPYSISASSKEERMTELLKEIESLANKALVYLIDIKPIGTKEDNLIQKYLVSIRFEAQMEQLINFIYNIESSEKLLTIERYRITTESKESSIVNCNMLVAQIVIP